MCIFSKLGNCNYHDLESYGFEHDGLKDSYGVNCDGNNTKCPFYCNETECE